MAEITTTVMAVPAQPMPYRARDATMALVFSLRLAVGMSGSRNQKVPTRRPLFDKTVQNLKPGKKPYKRSDGGGLYVFVTPDGARYWRMAYRFNEKQRTLALGVYPTISLSEAREARCRKETFSRWH
jgi:hypothetical protein